MKTNYDIHVNNFSEAKEKLGIKNVTQFLKYLKDKNKYNRTNKLNENENRLKNHVSKMKGYDVKLTGNDIFWIEDILDSHLYRLQQNIEVAIEKGDSSSLDDAEITIQKARRIAKMCEKMHIFWQYHKFKEDEKKHKRVGKCAYGLKDVKDTPYYVTDARKQFTKNMKQIKKKIEGGELI